MKNRCSLLKYLRYDIISYCGNTENGRHKCKQAASTMLLHFKPDAGAKSMANTVSCVP